MRSLVWLVRLVKRVVPALLVALTTAIWCAAAAQENPWTPDRQKAVVRVEVPRPGEDRPDIGTGFVVSGNGRYYVITATHVVLPDDPEPRVNERCLRVRDGTRLFLINRGGTELGPRCVYHLPNDISLIALESGDRIYPALQLSGRDLMLGEEVHIAGYPQGGSLDVYRSGMITGKIDDRMIADILTAGGMGGGPYLDRAGYAVGVHLGGLRSTPGFAQFVPIWAIRAELEKYLPDIPVHDRAPSGSAAIAQDNPWTPARQSAVVRVEAPDEGEDRPSVGAGFIANGKGGDHYVVTATHVVLPDATDVGPSDECLPLLRETLLFRVNRGGNTGLLGRCAFHLGEDISLILLEPGEGEYPTLPLSNRELQNRDRVYLAGYPSGGVLDANRSGQVTSWDSGTRSLILDIDTTGGMSGGPYLDETGAVVGIHLGGLRLQDGFPHMLPVWAIESELEKYLPAIPGASAEPEPDLAAPAERSGGAANPRVESGEEEGDIVPPNQPAADEAPRAGGVSPDAHVDSGLAIAVTTTLQDPEELNTAEDEVVEPLAAAVFQRVQAATGDEIPVFDSATRNMNEAAVVTYLSEITFDRALNRTRRIRALENFMQTSGFKSFREAYGFDSLYLINIDKRGTYVATSALLQFGENGVTYPQPLVNTSYDEILLQSLETDALRSYAAQFHRNIAGLVGAR